MSRVVLRAGDGMVLTDGSIYGKVIYLAEGVSGDAFYEITEDTYMQLVESGDISSGEATAEDYQNALRAMGVNV